MKSDIKIVEVTNLSDLKKFARYPFFLYRGNRFWCPPLLFDEMRTLRRDRNPAFEHCEASYWMAYRDGRPVGRIAGIINHRETECWNHRMTRFGWIDFIDEHRVSKALIDTVDTWGRSKGMKGLHGPLGFNDMDPEGMMTEGFEEMSSLAAIYNYAYYTEHMERLGFSKGADWVQFELKVPDRVPEKMERVSRIVLQKYDLRILRAKSSKEIYPYAPGLFDMYNEAYRNLYGFTPLSDRQIAFYTKQYFDFIQPDFVSLVLDADNRVAGFGISMPCLAKALQKANGSLFPFGFIHLLRAMRKNDTVHMFLVGVRPDYQEKGLLAVIYEQLTRNYIARGIKTAHTHPMLEENHKVIAVWKNYDGRINIRRRVWVRG